MAIRVSFAVVFALIIYCNRANGRAFHNSDSTEISDRFYSEYVLIAFLDSIGKLDASILVGNSTFLVDSTLKNQLALNKTIDFILFQQLKAAVNSGVIDLNLAREIFPELKLHEDLRAYSNDNLLPIDFFSFDQQEDSFHEFAITIGRSDGFYVENDIYFFKSNKIIAKHSVYHRQGLQLKHFKNEINETVIYYRVNYASGSGIWWNQFNFYTYQDDELLPVLTEIKQQSSIPMEHSGI